MYTQNFKLSQVMLRKV